MEHERGLVASEDEQKKKSVVPRSWVAVGAAFLLNGCQDAITYLTAEPYQQPEETRVLTRLNVQNSFPVDEAQLSEDGRLSIQSDVGRFLDELNSREGIEKLARSRVIIKVSSDERPTARWGSRGNEALSQTRLQELDTTLRGILSQYNFTDGASITQIQAVRDKTFTHIMPAGSWGVGFTPLVELINPKTGGRYTPDDLQGMTPHAVQKLYDQARYSEILFVEPGFREREKQYDKLVDIISGYEDVILLLDNSGSMSNDYGMLGKSFDARTLKNERELRATEIHVVPFSFDVDAAQSFSVQIKSIGERLSKGLPGSLSSDERVFASLNMILQKNKRTKDTRQAIVILTDEGIQDFSGVDLRGIGDVCDREDRDVYFGLIGPRRLITFVDHKGLLYEYQRFAKNSDRLPKELTDLKKRIEWCDRNVEAITIDSEGSLVFKVKWQGLTDWKYWVE
ncbi:MAG: vWA domain-containing protein [Candidatus Uhrbacteria bacterium]|nr:vWA domain-containing protein [Candidatus Uhrbacteria bacterium]